MHARKEQLKSLSVLKKRSDFLTIQKHGKKWVSHGLILQVRENDLGVIRVGYTVTKKIDKRAARRNRIKRRLRSVVADVLCDSAKGGVDYILVGRVKTATRPYETLCNDLQWCLKKTGFYQEGLEKEEAK
jgi:ribonuclease P protein component